MTFNFTWEDPLEYAIKKREERLKALPPPTDRWTKPRMDGRLHEPSEPCECAHCSHIYPGFNERFIILHCRQEHPEFYKIKWEQEIVPSGMAPLYPGWEPKDC